MEMKAISIFFLVLMYPIVSALLLRATRSTRDEFAELLRRMLQDPSIDEEHKIRISAMADDVFDWRFMAFATFAFPWIAFTGDFKTDLDETDIKFLERDDAKRLIALHMRCVTAASPLFTLTFAIVSFVSIAFLIFRFGATSIWETWADTVKYVSPKSA
ncbi:hypothetical protein [Roseibium sp.]|uniref:hypothetical protein n=1 Tax=Roseibium sp. TaxID=1936156 RepID=UPI003A96F55C